MKLRIAIVLIILVLLALTNPGMEDFKESAKTELLSRLEEKTDLEQALGNLFSGTLMDMLASRTKRTNCLLFSIYSFDINKKTYSYLGIATFILPLQTEFPLEEVDDLQL